MNRTQCLAVLLAGIAASMSGCGTDHGARAKADEPFSFAQIRELARPIGAQKSGISAGLAAQLRRDAPDVSKLYRDALTRFDGTYGEGVGPAKRSPAYLKCKAAFRDVAAWSSRSSHDPAGSGLDQLWANLEQCRGMAERLAGPVEMATFGNDLGDMTSGAMLVLAYGAAASGSDIAPSLYAESLSGPAKSR